MKVSELSLNELHIIADSFGLKKIPENDLSREVCVSEFGEFSLPNFMGLGILVAQEFSRRIKPGFITTDFNIGDRVRNLQKDHPVGNKNAVFTITEVRKYPTDGEYKYAMRIDIHDERTEWYANDDDLVLV